MRIDSIFENASFVTLDSQHPTASRIGVLNGRIVGLDEELDDVVPDTRVDLDGAFVVPGFNDVHIHTAWLGRTLSEIDLTDLTVLDALYDRIADWLAERENAGAFNDSDWVLCTGFDHHRFGGRYPDIARLDSITRGHPLFMRHTSGHASVVNTVALELIGATDPGFHDPEGGRVVRDESGRPTGLVQENAQNLVQNLFKPYSTETIARAIRAAGQRLASQGITSLTDAGVGDGWIGDSPIQLLAYQQLRDADRLPVRAQVMPTIDTLHPIGAAADDDFGLGLDLGIRTGLGDDMLSLGPVKVFADGSLCGETAAMTAPYRGTPDNCGYLQHDAATLTAQITDAIRSGWSVATHAIGDHGIDVALDAYVTALSLTRRKPLLPLRVEHAAVLRPDQLQRIAQLGVVPTTQSVFFDNMGDGIIGALTPERLQFTYRGKSLLDAGIILPGSSDAPCASESALLGIEKFVTRTTGEGQLFGPRKECLSVREALECYTTGSAAATGFASTKGRLARGCLADFVALGVNLLDAEPETISQTPVRATVLGGKFTYQNL